VIRIADGDAVMRVGVFTLFGAGRLDRGIVVQGLAFTWLGLKRLGMDRLREDEYR